MTKQILALTLLSLISATASADHYGHGFNPHDTAGVWTGVSSGTFMGQPYASVSTVTISHDGQSAIAVDDSNIGALTSSCTLTSSTENGTALVYCKFTAGAATGAEFDVHYAYTDVGQHLKLWVSNPAINITSDLTRP